jgi:hypothetical protein
MMIQYTQEDHLTNQEKQTFGNYDRMLAPLAPQYKLEPNFRSNQGCIMHPKFMYSQFLNNFRYWVDKLDNVETHLAVSDFESTDGDPFEMLNDVWGERGHFVNIEPLGGDKIFNRGLGLNVAASLVEDADYYFFTDVDCILTSTNMLKHGDIVTSQGGVLFPIFHKEMCPNGIFRYVEWAGNGQSFVPKHLHDKVGGFPEYWKWGKEDTDYRKRLEDTGATVITDDYPDLIHSWHSDCRRDTK